MIFTKELLNMLLTIFGFMAFCLIILIILNLYINYKSRIKEGISKC